MNVLITVDTEVEPCESDWRATALRDDVRREVFGETARGDFGINYQMELLDRHGLKAAFFVEGLFATAVGIEPLREVVDAVQSRGHEVQLHLHAEWLAWMEPSILPGRTGYNIRDFSEDDQDVLIATALANLRAAGAQGVCAFRAGNYGADFRTLRALARNGIAYDTSYNPCYLDTDCGIRTQSLLLHPAPMEGVIEFPIGCFQDYPRHLRHAQLCACSAAELEGVLMTAWKAGWGSFVIVSHSFELLRLRKTPGRMPLPDWLVVRRFRRLCRFLERNRDKFKTCGFVDLDHRELSGGSRTTPLTSPLWRTARRSMEQACRKAIAGGAQLISGRTSRRPDLGNALETPCS